MNLGFNMNDLEIQLAFPNYIRKPDSFGFWIFEKIGYLGDFDEENIGFDYKSSSS
jgi:hypothetical protein